jgi:hypothetical protein
VARGVRDVAVDLGQVAGDVMLVPEQARRSAVESICRVLTARGWAVAPSMCRAAGRHLLSGSSSWV